MAGQREGSQQRGLSGPSRRASCRASAIDQMVTKQPLQFLLPSGCRMKPPSRQLARSQAHDVRPVFRQVDHSAPYEVNQVIAASLRIAPRIAATPLRGPKQFIVHRLGVGVGNFYLDHFRKLSNVVIGLREHHGGPQQSRIYIYIYIILARTGRRAGAALRSRSKRNVIVARSGADS
jgi:hypothetical protein